MPSLRPRVALVPVLSLLILAPFFPGPLQRQQAQRIKSGGTLRVRTFTLNAFQPEFDPAGSAHVFILNQLYDGLVRLDRYLRPVGALADYWMISSDGRTYTFFLRRGVKFHHGREFEAEDVKFSLERLVHRETKAPHYQYLTTKVVGAQEYRDGKAPDVAGFRVVDKHTLEIHWKNPYVSALYLLSMDFCKILPRELVQRQGRGFFGKPSGTGPFKFAHWLRGRKLEIIGVRLERNNGYFARKAYLDALEFSPFYTPEEFLEGKVDIIPYTSGVLAGHDIQVREGETFTTAFLMMSCHLAPLDNPAIRRAISLGIDKKEVAKTAFQMDTSPQVTDSFIPSGLPGFLPLDRGMGFNPEEAKKILLQAGFSGEGSFPRLTLYIMEDGRNDERKLSGILKGQLAALGIDLRLMEYQTWEEIKSSRDPYLVLLHWSLDFPDPENLVLPLFHSGAALNQSLLHFSNPHLDELAREAEIEQSRTERIALFHEIEGLLQSDVPAIPLFSRFHRLALQPYVRGVRPPPLGFFYLDAKDIWLDK